MSDSPAAPPLRVGEVATLSGLTIRTLRHYHDIGLLVPSGATQAGYRLYERGDLARLQQILFFRELAFPLAQIRAIVGRPDFDATAALAEHRRILAEKKHRLEALIDLIDRSITERQGGDTMTDQQRFAPFDDAKVAAYREEARQRWGHTDAYQESERRVARMTKADWEAIGAETSAIYAGLVARMERPPTDPEVQALIERHFRQINDRFYNCSTEIYRGMADNYVADARFAAHFNGVKVGLAEFMRAAMHAFADRREGKAR